VEMGRIIQNSRLYLCPGVVAGVKESGVLYKNRLYRVNDKSFVVDSESCTSEI